MNHTHRSPVLLLVSSLLVAQENLPNPTATLHDGNNLPASDRGASARAVNKAALRVFPSPFQISQAYISNAQNSVSAFNAVQTQSHSLVPARFPIALSTQASGSNTAQASAPNTPAHPTPNKHRYWTKRRIVILAVGIGLAGAGASMWTQGKNLANPNYNLNACQIALLSGGVGTGTNPSGDAAVGKYCNETVPGAGKKAGLWLMVGGGGLSSLSFLPSL